MTLAKTKQQQIMQLEEDLKEMFRPKINENYRILKREPLYQAFNSEKALENTVVVSAMCNQS